MASRTGTTPAALTWSSTQVHTGLLEPAPFPGPIPPKAVWSETVFVRDVLRVDERLPNAAPRTSSHAVAAQAYLPPGRSGAVQAEADNDGLEVSAPAECPHDDPPQNG